jgi:aminopeptidase N
MILSNRIHALVASIAALSMAGAGAPDPMMGPGISRELATERAANLSGVRYEMRLSVAAAEMARGSITIRFAAKKATDVIIDFRGPRLANIVVNDRTANTAFNGMHLRIPAEAIRPGANVVSADFSTPIAAAGASIIKFHDDKDGSDYLYTLLVPSDANLLFPCFDQPDLKARLSLELTVPQQWNALAKGVTERVDTPAGLAIYTFRESDPLPTYLFAFAAGRWKTFTGGPRSTNLWVRASRASEVEVDSLQDQVASALTSI